MTDPDATAADSSSPGALTVSVSQQAPDWGELLARSGQATLLHDPRWGRVMREAYGNRAYYVTAQRGPAVVGILQLVLQKSLLFGTHLCSLPYFDASGVLADDREAADALVAEAARLRTTTGAEWVELRHLDALPGDLACRDDKVTLRLGLPDDPETLWAAFTPKVRNQVRKAEKAGLTLHAEPEATLDEFYAVYARTMRDLGSPPHSKRFFSRIRDHFGDAVRLYAVRQAGAPLAASLTLTDAATVRVPWAGADWRFRKLNANMLLYWGMLKDACTRGAACFDFGRSTRDSGTHRFKKQWGAEEVTLHWQYVLPEGGAPPEIRAENPKYRFLVNTWRRLPVFAARLIGPRIIRKLS